MARPWWVHSDGRPYDELDFGKTRVYDELDAREHDTKLERSAEQTIFRRALNRLKAAARPGSPAARR